MKSPHPRHRPIIVTLARLQRLAVLAVAGCLPSFSLPEDSVESAACGSEGQPCCESREPACASGLECDEGSSRCMRLEQGSCVTDAQCRAGQTCCLSGLIGSGPLGADPGLVLHYSFDEGAGLLVHDSVLESNAGVIHGGAPWTEGKHGSAVSLEGSPAAALDPQYVELPSGLLEGLEETSIVAWVRWEGGGQWQRIFDFGWDTGRCFFMTPSAPDAPGTPAPDAGAILDLGLVAVRPAGGAPQVHLQIRPSLPVSEWNHVAVTWSSTELVVYLNGQKAATTPQQPWAPAPGAGPVSLGDVTNAYIGRSLSPVDDYFAGAVDEFRIYDRALTHAEVLALRDASL
jgi:hypothetical protein